MVTLFNPLYFKHSQLIMYQQSFVNMSETSEESQDYSTGQFTSVSTCYFHVLQFSFAFEFQSEVTRILPFQTKKNLLLIVTDVKYEHYYSV